MTKSVHSPATGHVARRRFGLLLGLFASLLSACASTSAPPDEPQGPDIRILAFNDFHGALQAPRLSVAVRSTEPPGSVDVPAGGAAYFAATLKALRAGHPRTAVVSAGDMIGATPLVSALFLDEATIDVMNLMGIDFHAVGNHEFDRGQAELQRMQSGGCERNTDFLPCRVNPAFPGANFRFLAGNVLKADGSPLFAATGLREFQVRGRTVRIGFIGLTLRDTPRMVSPAGVAGLSFADEAATANALVPALKRSGAQAIVLLLHEGGQTQGRLMDDACPALSGDVLPILSRLDPSVDVVVSGHTHRAYVCRVPGAQAGQEFLLTSAGQYGTLLTSIDLWLDPRTGGVVRKQAANHVVRGEAFTNAAGRTVAPQAGVAQPAPDPAVAAVVERYALAARGQAEQVVGWVDESLTRTPANSREHALGNLVADAQWWATRAPGAGGAQFALMNPGGIRADLLLPPGGGNVSYGQLFSIQPFGNTLVVKTYTGAQLQRVLEQQFLHASYPRVLFPSSGFRYTYDLSMPPGQRISQMRLNGEPIRDDIPYRVTVNSFLATGGDGFPELARGTDPVGGPLDVEALAAYVRAHPALRRPSTDRIERREHSNAQN